MNFESSIDAIEISSKGRYLYLGCDNQVIHILKDIGMMFHSSSGSGSFESLRTLSSNELEKRKKDSLKFGNLKEGFFSVKYGSKTKKRKTFDTTNRKSSFSNNKELLSKGSYEIRYQKLRSDSTNIKQSKSKADLVKINTLMSIYEEKEKFKSPDNQKDVSKNENIF